MLTHKELLATRFAEHLRAKRRGTAPRTDQSYDRTR
jgi:hypothetical protein